MRPLSLCATLALLAVFALTHQALAQSADPLKLPVAIRQLPRWDQYAALGVPGQVANFRYPDPTTGVMVTKVTSATWPLADNPDVFIDYSEGGPHVSGEWTVAPGTTRHTILIRPKNARPFLVDYQRGVGVVSPTPPWQFPQTGPFPRYDLTSSFSNVVATARIVYFVDNDAGGRATLYRFNTDTHMFEGDGGNITAAGVEIKGRNPEGNLVSLIGGRMGWLQSSKNDEWFVFMWCPDVSACVPTKVFAFNRLTNTLLEGNCTDPVPMFQCRDWTGPEGVPDGNPDSSDLDEPHVDRDGGYVQLLDGTRDNPEVPGDSGLRNCGRGGTSEEEIQCRTLHGRPCRIYEETYWHLWDLTNGTVVCKGPVRTEGIYSGHPAWVRGYFVSADPNLRPHWNHYYDRAQDTVTNTVTYSHDKAFLPSHHAGQWIQGVTDTFQWYWGSSYNDGEALPMTGVLEPCPLGPPGANDGWQPVNGGPIYRAGINWNSIFEKPAIGIRAVYQTLTDDPTTPAVDPDANRLGHNLTQVGTLGAMTEPGTFFHDTRGDTCPDNDLLFVWALGDVNPTGRVHFFAPTPVHRGVGARRVNGTDVRLLAHNYAWPDAPEEVPLATTSPDGKLVMFHSNMGKRDGRTDVFIMEVPQATGGGGGGCDPRCPRDPAP